ncbi:MAG: AIPR family protein [Firmicutes bacterium]|nr:AIPR family protein [Bacillota bacterium]
MEKLNLKIPVKSFKRFENPYNPKDTPAKYQFFMNTLDVPRELENWLDVNPREQKLNTDVARAILESLNSFDDNFHLLNRGLLIAADEISYDNQSCTINLVLSDIGKHGIVDGGHTFRQILASQNSPKNQALKFVQCEVITNVSHIESLAEARNTSVAVDDKSMEELKGSFDSLKSILDTIIIDDDKFLDRVAFKQNEFWSEKKANVIDVREVIAILNMFNPYLYNPRESSHPIQSYTGKEVSLARFIKLDGNGNKEGNKDFRDMVIKQMAPIIPDIFKLWDKIEREFPEVSRDLKRRYGSKPYSNHNNPNAKKISLFSNYLLEYTIPRGIMYPVVGAFRALIKVDDTTGMLSWGEIDPFSAWDEKKEFIVNTILDSSEKNFSNSPERIGKASILWDSLYYQIMFLAMQKAKN